MRSFAYQIWSFYLKPFHRYWGSQNLHIYRHNLHCACAVSCDTSVVGETWSHMWFSHTHISCSLCNIYGAIISHKGRFLFTPMEKNSLVPTIEKCFGVKGERFEPRDKPIPKEHTHYRNTFFGCIERKSTLLRVSCVLKIWQIMKLAKEKTFCPTRKRDRWI